MTIYSPKFDVSNFELRDEIDNYLNQDQFGVALDTKVRVPAQLDWLGQLLGWSGSNYWDSYSATVDQKRQLLAGSYGVYNGYIYPEIIEVRNWSNTVVIKNDPNIREGQIFILNDSEYLLKGATLVGENLELDFGVLPDQFYSDISTTTNQLKVTAPGAIPAPFRRPLPGVSADRSFTCKVDGGAITLYPSFNVRKDIPYKYNVFYAGARYYFDLPVVLFIDENTLLTPTYSFDKSMWYIGIPCDLKVINVGLSARLEYEGSFLIVTIRQWLDPSDWLDEKTIKYFIGAWGNKGGYLPFHHVFDSLSLHGFSERKSLYLEPFQRTLNFDDLLKIVYQQVTTVNETPPPVEKPFQVWWNPDDRKFLVYQNDPVNCGPWIESYYPQGLDVEMPPDAVFLDVASFRAYPDEFEEGVIVDILDGSGLAASDHILGITQILSSTFSIRLFKPKGGVGWHIYRFIYPDVVSFELDSIYLPAQVTVNIDDSTGLTETGANYKVSNLKFTINDPYPVVLMKYEVDGSWYLSPPTTLKYIGDTRLFETSVILPDYTPYVEGEMQWDFTEPNPSNRVASIFFFTRWEYDPFALQWQLRGDWYNVNTGERGNLVTLNSLIGGSGYVDGVYTNVALLGGEGQGAYADITVTSGSVVDVTITQPGQDYRINDTLYSDDAEIGGGSGFSIEVQTLSPGEPPTSANFDTVLVYCDGNLLADGETYLGEGFQFLYSINTFNGKFTFNYSPDSYESFIKFPKITISDSLTSSYSFDISNLVFSGLSYYASPNVCDSETLLRLWKSNPLFCVNDTKEQTSLSYPNGLVADLNKGPGDPNWERYFVRLPPSYQRDGAEWQKVNLTCQNFGYWGSPTLPEDMVCPAKREKPDIYEEIVVKLNKYKPSSYVYSEPYFYSTYTSDFSYPEDYNNSFIAPVPDGVKDGYSEGKVIRYDPLHERRVDTESPMGRGYGDWEGEYYRISDCSELNGHLVNDINQGSVEGISQPVWDASIYKIPNTCVIDGASGRVDANHFKVGYAFFLADMSAAEEAVFDFV